MGMLDAENANRKEKSTSSKSSSGGSTKSSGSTSNHASEREIDRSTGNRSTTDRSSSANSDRPERSTSSVGSDRREIDRSLAERPTSDRSTGLNSSGNRSTGAGPMSSSNRNTTPTGFSAAAGHSLERAIDRSLSTPTGGLYSSAGIGGGYRTAENQSMTDLDRYRSAELASKARASEIKSMTDYGTYRSTDMASRARAAENQSMADLTKFDVLATIRRAEAGTLNPYNRLVDGGPQKYADLTSMTVRDVITYAGTLRAAGHKANVLGAYQFKNTTLAEIATQMGVLDQKFTPELQDQLAHGLVQRRADFATVNGQIDVDKFAHQLAQEWAALKTSSGGGYWDKNGVDKGTVDYAAVRDMAKNLVDHGVVSPKSGGGQRNDLPSRVSTIPSARPSSLERFESTYLGGSRTNTGGLSQRQIEAYKDAGLNKGYAPVDPVNRSVASNTPASVGAPASRSVPVVRQQPSVRPTTPTIPASASPSPAAPAKRSTGQTAMAGGIDVLAGMIPGVGTGLTIANAGLALTGNRTIGERIVDDFANGSGKNGSDLMPGNSSERPDRTAEPKKKPTSAVKTSAERFEETYLKPFDDGVARPTPKQKWDNGRDYSGQA